LRTRVATSVLALVGLTISALAAETPPRRAYLGRPLPAVILELERGGGLRVIYSSELVRPDMVVAEEPQAGPAREVLREVLARHALELRPGPGGSLLVVRGKDVSPGPAAAESRFAASVEVEPSSVSLFSEEPGANHVLTRKAIERTPHFSDDPFRIVPRLPGTAGSDFTTAFHIRGGDENETLVLFDGLDIPQPFHLRSAQSILTVFDAKAIGGIQVSTGGFAAEHGTKMGGVLDITSLSPREKPHFALGISLLSVDLLTDGRFAGGRGQWLFSARRGILELATKLSGDDDEFQPVYYDAFARVQYQPSGATTLTFNALLASDDGSYTSTAGDQNASAKSRSVQGWLTLSTLLTPSLLVRTLASAGTDTSSQDGNQTGDTNVELQDRRTFRSFGLKQDWDWDATGAHHLKAGLEARSLRTSYDHESTSTVTDPLLLALGAAPVTVRSAHLEPSGGMFAAYLSDRVRLSPALTAELGVRWDRETYAGASDLAPRLNVAFAPSPGSVLRAGWGVFVQGQGIQELHVADGQDRFFPAQRSEHRILGFEQALGNGVHLKVEAYQKLIRNPTPRYENLISALSLFHEYAADRTTIAPDRCESRGLELQARRDGKRLSWSASYGLAYAQDEIGGETFPRSWDQRHTFQLGLSWRPGRSWMLGTAFTYRSGWPTTDILVTRSPPPDDSTYSVAYGPRNDAKLPVYNRLDLRVSRQFQLGRGSLTTYVDVFNVYNRQNATSVDEIFFYLRPDGTIGSAKTFEGGMSVLPSFGVKLEF
jgi:hypothetical protein